MLCPAACAASPPAAAGGLVGPHEQRHLGGLADGVRPDGDVADPVRGLTGEGHDAGAAATLAGGGRCGLRRGQQSGLAEVGGVRVAGRLALHDPDARAPVATGRHLLDLAVVQVGRRRALVLDVDLGEVGAGPQACAEHPLDEVAVDQVGLGARIRRVVGHAAEPTDAPRRAALQAFMADATAPSTARPAMNTPARPDERGRGGGAGAEAPPEPPPPIDPAPPVDRPAAESAEGRRTSSSEAAQPPSSTTTAVWRTR